ncbi:MAG: heterodisulfide reductase-related iron-sulfur binding cluster [Deinococcales bacterium]
MQHRINPNPLGPYAEPMSEAVSACVHCGFCLPTCPTYQVMGEEMDSPRGRIFLMKEVLEGQLELSASLPYVDNCLGCLACVTACPSGVAYGDLLTPFRALAEKERERPFVDKVLRTVILETLPYPHRFRLASQMGQLAKLLTKFLPPKFLPQKFKDMMQLLPENLPKREALASHYPAKGPARAKVILLSGCAQQVLAPEINQASLNILSHNGVEVLVPPAQGCCGALAAHTGAMARAKAFAKHNLKVFESLLNEVDAVISNAAGCGSGLHEYALWLKGSPEEDKAQKLSAKSQDISVFLNQLGLIAPPKLSQPIKVAYHDACHLAHAQGVLNRQGRYSKHQKA